MCPIVTLCRRSTGILFSRSITYTGEYNLMGRNSTIIVATKTSNAAGMLGIRAIGDKTE